MAVVLSVQNLKKVYRSFFPRVRVVAVDGISFEVKAGEVFGILGPNGSGKTTSLKMILGLLKPTEGDVRIFGRPPQDVSIRRRIGYLPEKTALYGFLNAYETLRMFGTISGMRKEEADRRAQLLLDRLDLKEAKRRTSGYSKGMARKVAFAQAVLNEPELLILDEPTSGLDPVSAAEVHSMLEEFKAAGKTIIISSHILSDIQRMCDRVIIMAKGKICAEGSLMKLLKREGYIRLTLKGDMDKKETIVKVLEEAGFRVEELQSDTVELDRLFLEVLGKDVSDSPSEH